MRHTIDWTMLLHHLDAASSIAEEAGLPELQDKIDQLMEQARRLQTEVLPKTD